MSEFDSKALASAREVMALTRQENIGGDAQLFAKIQLRFIEAMEYAAPQSFGNSEQLEPVSNRDELPDVCWCHNCRPVTMKDMRFVVCPDCGNKRCPKANVHKNAYTGSN
ncbi:hypothetical protein [Dryocola sp. BD613]|uniref:hypothetical protein n=1 Tax=Dryocola sp. BD613 TaxID=3133272 RepID=UPI003F4F7B95